MSNKKLPCSAHFCSFFDVLDVNFTKKEHWLRCVHGAIWAFHRGMCNETFCSVMSTVQYDEFTFYFVHHDMCYVQCPVHCGICWSWYMCNVMFNMSTMQIDILSILSTMPCAICNETCRLWNKMILICAMCIQYVHYAIWYTFYFVHYAMYNVQWDMSTVEGSIPAINVPPQMHQQQTKGRKYGANVLLGIWQLQKDQVL